MEPPLLHTTPYDPQLLFGNVVIRGAFQTIQYMSDCMCLLGFEKVKNTVVAVNI